MIPLCVITRTRNRSHLLKRALESLLSQTSQDFSWIIVDSSDIPAEAEKIAKLAKERLRDVRLIPSFGSAVGMEAASNIGIAAASSPYVTFLDDDDTWECEFVAQTMDFLQRNPAMAGVCVQSHVIVEQGDPPKTIQKYVMNADLRAIQIADMALFNHFTTNSLVYRRSVHDEIGMYREDLPVMGDWEFGMRLVLRHDIAVLPYPLANYHRRTDRVDPADPTANTVVAGVDLHAYTDARLRNEFLRKADMGENVVMAKLLGEARIRLRADELMRFRFLEVQDALKGELARLETRIAGLERGRYRAKAAAALQDGQQAGVWGSMKRLLRRWI